MFWCVPALHCEQAALPLPAVRPALQAWQACASGAFAKVFCGHAVHSSCPVRLLAFPGMHGRHDAELLSG